MKQQQKVDHLIDLWDNTDCNPISWETREVLAEILVSENSLQIGAGNQYPQLLLTLFTFPEEEHFFNKTRI